jgi:hypothetical protein
MALAAAGFGMMAGRSPQALQNIGSGALEGLNFYQHQKEAEPSLNLREAQAEQAQLSTKILKDQVSYFQNHDLDALFGNVANEKKNFVPTSAAGEPPPAAAGNSALGFKALLPIETKGDPNAVSPKGAVGLAQIMPETAAQYLGRPVTVAELKNPDLSLQLGQTIFSDLMQRYGGDTDAAWAAYNAGPATADKYVKSGKDLSVLPRETQDYIAAAKTNMAQLTGQNGGTNAAGALPGPQDPHINQIDQLLQNLNRQQQLYAQMPMMPADKLKLLQGIQEQQIRLLEAHPAVRATQAGAEALAKVAPALQTKQGEANIDLQTKPLIAGLSKAAEMPSTLTRGRPGDVMLQGTNPIFAVPTTRKEINNDPGSPNFGQEQERFITPPTGGQQLSGLAPIGTPGNSGQAASAAPASSAEGAPWTTALSPGQHEALTQRAKDEQEDRKITLEGAQAAQYQQSSLQRLKDDADIMYSGPFSQHVQDFSRVMRLIDPRFTGQVASYEDFIKNAGSLTRQATRETSPRAAFQEVKFIENTLPNPDMSPQGLRSVVNEYMGLNDYKMAKAKAQLDWETKNGGLGNVQGFEANWQAKPPVTPYTFIISRMDQPERQQLFAKWAKTDEGRGELQKLAEQRQYAVANGLQ